MRQSESPHAAWRPEATVIGPVGFALTNSTRCRTPVAGSRPYASPASAAAPRASRNHASARKRLRNPGPATSARSSAGPSASLTRSPRRSATARGWSRITGASSIGALLEKSPKSARGGRSSLAPAIGAPASSYAAAETVCCSAPIGSAVRPSTDGSERAGDTSLNATRRAALRSCRARLPGPFQDNIRRRGSVVVRLAGQDLVSAEQLLEQHHAGELVRQRHRAERELQIAFLERQPARPTDDEADVARLEPALVDEAAELHRVELPAVVRQQAHVGVVGDPPLDALLLAHLGELELRVPRKQLLVVLDVVGVGRLEAAHGQHDRPHGLVRY